MARSYIVLLCFTVLSPWSLRSQDVSYDIELGQQYSQVVELQMGLYDDVRLNEYVREIGEGLVQQLGTQPFDYSFKVIDSDMANAFALPGGFTYVTRGLLASVNDDSELAGVIAHEIIHVDKRHSVQQEKRGFLPSLLKVPGELVGAVAPAVGSLLKAPVELGEAVFDANYSRGHEKEADKLGIDLMYEAGYDPNGLPVILGRLAQVSEVQTGSKEKRSLVNDHPVTEKRLKYLSKEIEKSFDARDYNRSIDLTLLDGVLYGPNPAQGIIEENNAFIHPDLEMFVQFPQSWATENTPVAVGTMQPGQEAFWMLSAVEPGKSAQELYDTTLLNLSEQLGPYITRKGPEELNGFDTYTIVLEERESYAGLQIRITWLTYDGLVFQMTSYGYLMHVDALNSVFGSFRKTTQQELDSVEEMRISIVTAEEGETIGSLCSRVGCSIDDALVAAHNGMDESTSLQEGQKIKVVVALPYFD